MTDPLAILADRIDARLQALGISDRKASINAIGMRVWIRGCRRGQRPRAGRLSALAKALETTVAYLQGDTDVPGAPLAGPIPRADELPRDLPVYGTALGADAEFWSDHAGAVAIEQTDISTGDAIDFYRRPPALRDRPDVYLLYTAGDSMAPAFEAGQAIPVDPKRAPAIGNYVVVYLRGDQDETAAVLIKRLVKRSSSWIELEQFNPPATFRLEARQFRAVHRVMRWDEVLGV
jgi:hypothetical protein